MTEQVLLADSNIAVWEKLVNARLELGWKVVPGTLQIHPSTMASNPLAAVVLEREKQ